MGKINVSPNNKIKTVFVIDKSLFRKQSSVTSKVPIWNFAIDASLEYCRIVWDISPLELIRFILNDNSVFYEEIGTWGKKDPNLNLAYIKSSFSERITFDSKSSMDSNVSKGIKVALETLSLCSDDQLKEMESVADKGSKVSNKGRVICLTSILEDDSIETLECFAKKTITTFNEGNLKSNQMQIDNCDLLLINIFPDPPTLSALKEHPYFEISPFLSCELISVCANHQLVNCLKRLVLKHFDLASTTIESISFPSGVTKTPETPNRIEIFHPLAAHDCFAKPEFESPPFSFFMEKGHGYKTVVMSGYPTANLSSSSLIKLSSISPNCWRISPFVHDKGYEDLTAFLLNPWSGGPLLFKILLEKDTKLTNLFMLDAYKGGRVRLQQINWSDLEKSSIPVPLIQPREKVCPEKNKTSARHVGNAIVNQTVPAPLDSSNAGLKKNSQKIQKTKLNVDNSKPTKNIPKDTETSGKTKKISTPSIDENQIEQASKKRKTEVVNAPTAKLVTKKIAANDSATQISHQPPKPVCDHGASNQDHQAPQFIKPEESSLISRSTNSSWQVKITKTALIDSGITSSSKGPHLKVNPISTVSIGLDHSSKLPNPIPSGKPNRINKKTEIPILASAVTMDQDSLTAKKMRTSQDIAVNKSLNSSSGKPVPKKVRSSLPSLLPTENAGKILPPKDCPSINDPNDQEAHNKEQIKEAVGMDNEKMVQETQVPIGEIPPPPKKSVSSSTLSVAEVCSEFDLKDVQVDLETENLILQQGIEYKPYLNHVWPLVREANPSVTYTTLIRLIAAKWRQFSARHSRKSHLGEAAMLPGVAKNRGANLNSTATRNPAKTGTAKFKSAAVTNEEREGFKKQISHLNQEVTVIRSIVESLVTKSNTTGSLNSTSSSDITGGASSGSGTSITETLKEQPNSAQGPDDDLKIKLEIDDEIQLLYEVPPTRPNSRL